MPSRRALLAALGSAAAAGAAGCSAVPLTDDGPAMDEPCGSPTGSWPTAGGDPGRTGRSDAAPPPGDAEVSDLLAGVDGSDGGRVLAASLPAVSQGTAFVPTSAGVAAVDLADPLDGVRWVAAGDADVDAVPAVGCGAVFAAGLNETTALDPDGGDAYWTAGVGSHEDTALAYRDGTLYLAGAAAPVAVDPRTGEELWQGVGGDTLAVGPDGVYATENVNGEGAVYGHALGDDPDDRLRWKLSLGKVVASASVLDGTVYVVDVAGTVAAVDAASGATRWTRSPDGVSTVHSGLAVRGDDVVVPAGTGDASYVLDAATGETRWRRRTGIVTGRPVVGGDWVALGRTNAGVGVYDRASGDRRAFWSREEYEFGTVEAVAAVESGLVVRGGTSSGLALVA